MKPATTAFRIIAQRNRPLPSGRSSARTIVQQGRWLSSSEAVVVPSNSNPVDHRPPGTYTPIDFESAAKIEGEESHIVTIQLEPGECVRAESGAMIYMTESIQMNTTLGGGATSAMKRMLTGQNVFLTDFTCQPAGGETTGTLCLGTDFPSKILRLNLQDMPNETLICQRGAYMASNPTVDIEMEFTKSLSAGFFGGQGFVLQRLTGSGDVLVKGGGTIVLKELQKGEKLRVTSGSIVAFENTVDYDIQMMPGIKNAVFGGEGLFVTTLTGPGRVWLQGLPADRMISEIARRVPGPGIGFGIPVGVGGGGGGEGAAETAEPDAGQVPLDASPEERVAATDAEIDADRQATVASSGMMNSEENVDSDSPASLFGDAAPDTTETPAPSSESEFMRGDDFTLPTNEPTFSDTGFSSDEFTQDAPSNDGMFSDDTTSSDVGSDATEAAGESGSGIFATLWDLFIGRDDD